MGIMSQHAWFVVILAIFCKSIIPSDGFILIPEDLQSVLQLAYSLFPTINAGTQDSKVGVGFRLGKNADVQVLLEFGPETMSSGSSRRRQALLNKRRPFDTKQTTSNEITSKNTTELSTSENSTIIEPLSISVNASLNNTVDP